LTSLLVAAAFTSLSEVDAGTPMAPVNPHLGVHQAQSVVVLGLSKTGE
jgi:hypothetical protein